MSIHCYHFIYILLLCLFSPPVSLLFFFSPFFFLRLFIFLLFYLLHHYISFLFFPSIFTFLSSISFPSSFLYLFFISHFPFFFLSHLFFFLFLFFPFLVSSFIHLSSYLFRIVAINFYIIKYFLMHFNVIFRATINSFLVIDLVGCCCVYIVFISTNVKEVVDYYTETDKDLRLYMAMLLPLLIIFSLVRNLKYLAPFSMVANILIATGMGITFYYILSDLPTISDVPNFSSWTQLPIFFGTAIFALEGIGVVSMHTSIKCNNFCHIISLILNEYI